jgi:hypothetical protein
VRKVLKRLRVHWNQNIIGRSPEPPYTTWSQLKEKRLAGWDNFHPGVKQAKFKRLKEEFTDETSLMFQTFTKLIGVLTPLGIAFAFGQGALKNPLVKTSFAVSIGITIIWVVWGLSTRTKVFKRPGIDVGVSAMMVDDGEGSVIEDEIAADVWWLYTWHWHRHHTRVGIDRLFFLACVSSFGPLLAMLFV